MFHTRHTSHLVSLIMLLLILAVSGFGMSLFQSKSTKPKTESVKLEYSGEDEPTKVDGDLRPLALSSNRLLVPVGDTLYMLDAESKGVWEYSFEPNIIFDFIATPEGTIYIAVSDGGLIALDTSGKKVWHNFMCGSANYSQLKNYGGGFLVVVSMEGYREYRNSNSEDILEFWKGGKSLWSKEFPRKAELFVWGDKILAVTKTKTGKEIQEIK